MRRFVAMTIGAILATGALSASAAEATSVETVPGSIAADCSVDVSAALETFLAQLPNDSTVEFPTEGCFRVERQITLPPKVGITLKGNGSRLLRTEVTPLELRYPKSNIFLRFDIWRSSTIQDFKIEGTNKQSDIVSLGTTYGAWMPSMEFDAGINLRGGTDVTIQRVVIDGVYGDGIQMQRWGGNPTNIVIRDVTITRNGRQGITMSAASNVLLDRVTITGSRRSAIDFEPELADMVIDGVEIRNSEISAWLLAFSAYGSGPVNNVYLHDNVIRRTGVPFVYVESFDGITRHGWRVMRNTVTYGMSSSMSPMEFVNVRDVLVDRNVLRVSQWLNMPAIEMSSGSTGTVTNNWFKFARADYVNDWGGASWVGGNNSVSETAPPSTVDWVAPAPTVRSKTVIRRFNVSEPIRRGATVKLTGRLLRAKGDSYVPYSGRTVSVQFRPKGGTTFSTVKKTTTSTRGYFTAGGARAWRTGTWRVVFRGNTVALRSVSQGDYVTVFRG